MIKRLYGSGPVHLVVHVLALVLAVYAVVQITGVSSSGSVFAWLVAAVLLHDVLLWPLYSGADTAAQRILGGAVNYVRIPVGLSLVLVLAFFATLLGTGESTYRRASGLGWDGYVTRWLLVTAALFVVSGAVYVVRRARR